MFDDLEKGVFFWERAQQLHHQNAVVPDDQLIYLMLLVFLIVWRLCQNQREKKIDPIEKVKISSCEDYKHSEDSGVA